MDIWRWADGIDAVPVEHRLSLGVGDTPLVASRRLGATFGLSRLSFKLEMCNPTGSYKDRFAFCAVSHMLADGKSQCVATTSGNTGAALAGYCAAAGITCKIAVVEGAPLGKLQQMLAYGAQIFRVRQFGIDPHVSHSVFELLRSLGERRDTAMQISAFAYCPRGMSGVRTIGYELNEQLAGDVDHVFTQAGGGGLTLATAEAFQWLVDQGRMARVPRVECVQPAGNNTIAGPLRAGLDEACAVVCSSKVSGLQVANVIDGHHALRACRETGGTGHVVTDEFVWEIQRRLAIEEGIFCEPAGAAAVAGALQAAKNGELRSDASIVALVTGIGFKDPPAVERMIAASECPVVSINDLEARLSPA